MNTELKEKRQWFSLTIEEVAEKLKTNMTSGLDGAEVASRQETFGPNHLPKAERPSVLARFFKQFNNILIYILLVTAGLTAYMGHFVDTAVILAVVVVNAMIGFIQENRAEAAMDKIKNMLVLDAHAVRSGAGMKVPAEELTVGDLVRLKPGDKVPADLRLVRAESLKIEEAAPPASRSRLTNRRGHSSPTLSWAIARTWRTRAPRSVREPAPASWSRWARTRKLAASTNS